MQPVSPVSFEIINKLAIIEIDNPPVNSLSTPVRKGLISSIENINKQRNKVKLIVIWCKGKTFFSGADITEFEGKPPSPTLPETLNAFMESSIPILSALHGTTLGGGLEVALASSYRVANENTLIGFPEVNLGIIPGSGGIQFLSKIVTMQTAVDLICLDKKLKSQEACSLNIIDKILPNEDNEDYYKQVCQYAKKLISNDASISLLKNRATKAECNQNKRNEIIASTKQLITKKYKGHQARQTALDLIEKNYTKQYIFDNVTKQEREVFLDLKNSNQAKALRRIFFAEKNLAKSTASVDGATIAVIGAGTMGKNIAYACSEANFNTLLVDLNQDAITSAEAYHKATLSKLVDKNKISADKSKSMLNNFSYSNTLDDIKGRDIVIEAIFESIEAKTNLFKKLSTIVTPETTIATNTSYLDIHTFSHQLNNPANCVGLHFFNPAHRMKLLEIVSLKHTSNKTTDYAIAVAKKLKKIPIVVNHCFGFAANRLYTAYNKENSLMLLEGVAIDNLNKAFTDFGMPMGPLSVLDSSGIDIGFQGRSQNPNPPNDPTFFAAINVLAENSLFGKKTNAGFYLYEDGKNQKENKVNPAAQDLIQKKAKELNIKPRTHSKDEIVKRAFTSVINEGKQMIKENIIKTENEIDLIWIHGYGFPRHFGGPCFYFNLQTS